MKRWITLLLIATLALLISACGNAEQEKPVEESTDNDEEETTDSADEETQEEVTVSLNDLDGNEVAEATLTDVEEGVQVTLSGDGLPEEEAELAFHIHEKGVCEPDDFKSAGGHYNPDDRNHGKKDEDGPHAGDFDNIEVNENGEVDVEFTTDQISLDEDATNTVFTEDGTSFVIHAGPDDYESQPSGDAGDRIACGVIAEPK